MALPDKHADEPTKEAEPGLWFKYTEAHNARVQWERLEKLYRDQIVADLGDSFALTVDGKKVATYRPQVNYAVAQLQKDYPNLTEHYTHTVPKTVFDIELFAKAHPEIAEKYRIRAFKEVE